MSDLSPYLDPVLLVVLVATLIYAIKLEKALSQLRKDRLALTASVTGFDVKARDISSAMTALNQRTIELADQIACRIEFGKKLHDDLGYLSDRGDSIANKLEKLIRLSRVRSE